MTDVVSAFQPSQLALALWPVGCHSFLLCLPQLLLRFVMADADADANPEEMPDCQLQGAGQWSVPSEFIAGMQIA